MQADTRDRLQYPHHTGSATNPLLPGAWKQTALCQKMRSGESDIARGSQMERI